MDASVPTCRHCGRPDCALLATVIIGERAMYWAVGECMAVQRVQERTSPTRRVAAPRGGR